MTRRPARPGYDDLTAELYKVGDFTIGRLLGVGSFGKVKLATLDNRRGGGNYAVKIMEKDKVHINGLSVQIRREVQVMQTLGSHANIVQLHSVESTREKVYIFMELVKGGELFDEIVRNTRLPELRSRFYFTQLIVGLAACHARSIYHRDLKPENLLIDASGLLKISDFGLSSVKNQHPTTSTSVAAASFRQRERERGAGGHALTPMNFLGHRTGRTLLHTQCGTPNYVAPEIITLSDEKGYSGAKVDIWSCGVILFVLVAGSLPFDSDNTEVLFRLIIDGEIQYPKHFSQPLIDLCSNLLQTDPNARFSLQEITESRWMTMPAEELADLCNEDVSLVPDFPEGYALQFPWDEGGDGSLPNLSVPNVPINLDIGDGSIDMFGSRSVSSDPTARVSSTASSGFGSGCGDGCGDVVGVCNVPPREASSLETMLPPAVGNGVTEVGHENRQRDGNSGQGDVLDCDDGNLTSMVGSGGGSLQLVSQQSSIVDSSSSPPEGADGACADILEEQRSHLPATYTALSHSEDSSNGSMAKIQNKISAMKSALCARSSGSDRASAQGGINSIVAAASAAASAALPQGSSEQIAVIAAAAASAAANAVGRSFAGSVQPRSGSSLEETNELWRRKVEVDPSRETWPAENGHQGSMTAKRAAAHVANAANDFGGGGGPQLASQQSSIVDSSSSPPEGADGASTNIREEQRSHLPATYTALSHSQDSSIGAMAKIQSEILAMKSALCARSSGSDRARAQGGINSIVAAASVAASAALPQGSSEQIAVIAAAAASAAANAVGRSFAGSVQPRPGSSLEETNELWRRKVEVDPSRATRPAENGHQGSMTAKRAATHVANVANDFGGGGGPQLASEQSIVDSSSSPPEGADGACADILEEQRSHLPATYTALSHSQDSSIGAMAKIQSEISAMKSALCARSSGSDRASAQGGINSIVAAASVAATAALPQGSSEQIAVIAAAAASAAANAVGRSFAGSVQPRSGSSLEETNELWRRKVEVDPSRATSPAENDHQAMMTAKRAATHVANAANDFASANSVAEQAMFQAAAATNTAFVSAFGGRMVDHPQHSQKQAHSHAQQQRQYHPRHQVTSPSQPVQFQVGSSGFRPASSGAGQNHLLTRRLNRSGASFRSNPKPVMVNGLLVGAGTTCNSGSPVPSPVGQSPLASMTLKGVDALAGRRVSTASSAGKTGTMHTASASSSAGLPAHSQARSQAGDPPDHQEMVAMHHHLVKQLLEVQHDQHCELKREHGRQLQRVYQAMQNELGYQQAGEGSAGPHSSRLLKVGDRGAHSPNPPAKKARRKVMASTSETSQSKLRDAAGEIRGSAEDTRKNAGESSPDPKSVSAAASLTSPGPPDKQEGCTRENASESSPDPKSVSAAASLTSPDPPDKQEDMFSMGIPRPAFGPSPPPKQSKLAVAIQASTSFGKKKRRGSGSGATKSTVLQDGSSSSGVSMVTIAGSILPGASTAQYTQFHSLTPPRKCCELVEGALKSYGCSQVCGKASGPKSYKVKCVKVVERQPIVVSINIYQADGDLSAISFKRKGNSDARRFCLLFDDVHRIFSEKCAELQPAEENKSGAILRLEEDR